MAQGAIPRRSATLADDVFAAASPEPARGGPADRRTGPIDPSPGTAEPRTPVRPPTVLTPAFGVAGGGPGAFGVGREPTVGDPRADADRVGVRVSGGNDPMMTALRASAAASAVAAIRAGSITAVLERGGPSAGGSGTTTTAASGAADAANPPAGDPVAAPAGDPAAAPAGPCSDLRHLAEERCELATRARAQATAAEEAHRAAQRSYGEHEARADQAADASDPRAIRSAKDEAQAKFRAERAAAGSTEQVEAAARNWLLEINRINGDARDAAAVVTRERELIRTLTLDLERLAVEADAARIGAETAAAACLAAREAVADCEEAATGTVGHMPAIPSGAPDGDGSGGDDEPLAAALGSGGTPRIFRLVRGDRTAMVELVGALAGDDPGQRRHWQLALSDLVDAILADSIAASSLDFPADHPFWSPFTADQNRDIAGALSSLGYRFDGLGGWVDGRVPSQRDLSLALGYAGIDPMRIRHWPTEVEMAELYRDVAVAADERLAGAAGDLTLGELVSMLGRRADGLADVWNDWGRLRPLLLEER
jgi:hypothetical protein